MPNGDVRRRKNDDADSMTAKTNPVVAPPASESPKPSNLAGDWGSIALLSILYTLQGIPMGLSGSVPLLLAKKVGWRPFK